ETVTPSAGVASPPVPIELAEVPRRPVPRPPQPPPPPPPRQIGLSRSRFAQRALAYLALVILAVGGLRWLLRRTPAPSSAEADVSFDVVPVRAALRLD